ncbi:hypothetical protein Cgig2_012999 [Carnegiea gigantea]|uniref:Uncharacterized protein n=1 Tax=Carnegiea gigantea TaxID=171969 RepID=A0A9Q1QE59_9CARY|nr:hypothetical protein Cgig2_012999 [Carnegiea gigantea]
MKYWGVDSLSKLASILGILVKIDKQTMDKIYLNDARLLIDISLDEPFPEYVDYINDRGLVTRQNVKYEWLPLKSNHCSMFEHLEADCKRKRVIRQEWRTVTTTDQDNESRKEQLPLAVGYETQEEQPAIHHIQNRRSCNNIEFISTTRGGNRSIESARRFQCSTSSVGQDRRDEVQDIEIREFSDCMTECELIELRSYGNYFSWSNRGRNGQRIWSKIDRAFSNLEWYNVFDFTQVENMAEEISYHTPLLITFPNCPRPQASFKYYDM